MEKYAVRSYKDLQVWQKAMDSVTHIYEITQTFPKEEIYGLTSQIRRSAISIPSNIAEGSSRRSTKEFIRFINIAIGSLAELETQLLLANNLGYLQKNSLEALMENLDHIGKMLSKLHAALVRKLSDPKITRLETRDS